MKYVPLLAFRDREVFSSKTRSSYLSPQHKTTATAFHNAGERCPLGLCKGSPGKGLGTDCAP